MECCVTVQLHYGIGIDFFPTVTLKHPSYVHGVRQLLEAVAGGGFAEPSKGKLELSASQLERLKTVRTSWLCAALSWLLFRRMAI